VAKAGIVTGDVITAVNGQAVTSLADLQSSLAQLLPGQTVSLTVKEQGGNSRTVHVTLGQL
jgi:S1-C subfamily serine protease